MQNKLRHLVSGTPALTPEEREGVVARSVTSCTVVAVAAVWPITERRIANPERQPSPKHGRWFTLSSGERARVRAGVITNHRIRFGDPLKRTEVRTNRTRKEQT